MATAADKTELLLNTHLRRALTHASAFRATVRRILPAYKPPLEDGIGWDTKFMPRPTNQAYVPIPMIWYAVNIMSAVMGMRPPVISVEPKSPTVDDRKTAADTELLLRFEWMRQNMEEVHLDMCKNLSLKGRAGLKLGYGPKDELWTENIDLIENLYADWSNDSYRQVHTWSYHSLLHPDDAKAQYNVDINPGGSKGSFFEAVAANFYNWDHSNPLGRGTNLEANQPPYIGVPLIDFHWKDPKGKVMNSIFVGRTLVEEKDTKMDDFPYLVVNCDTEPGNPFGIGDAEPVIGLQLEYATRLTAWAEAIRRNGQDQWVTYNLRGLTPKDLPGGGRYFPLGDPDQEKIEPLKFPIDNMGFNEYILHILEEFRRVTGIPPELMGGGAPARASTSGYAMAIRFQSIVTRLGPREARLKAFYRHWALSTLKNMEIVNPQASQIIQSNYFTTVQFEAVTPKDMAETIASLSSAVAAGITSRRTAIDSLHKVPEDEMEYMREWNTDPALSPATAAAAAQAEGQMQAIQQGSTGAMGQQQQAAQEQAQPNLQGGNQHTIPGRQSAAELVGPNMGSPVSGAPSGMPTL